jgi:hypothetical protein
MGLRLGKTDQGGGPFSDLSTGPGGICQDDLNGIEWCPDAAGSHAMLDSMPGVSSFLMSDQVVDMVLGLPLMVLPGGDELDAAALEFESADSTASMSEAFAYAPDENVSSIMGNGLRPYSFATPKRWAHTSPSELELALPQTNAATAMVRIDIAAIR